MKKVKYFVLGFSISAIIFNSPTIKAADVLKNIQVAFSNIPIYVEGTKANFTKSPMIYNGTTYLPVRSVAETLGKKVLYDKESSSIYIYSEGNEPEIKKEITNNNDTSKVSEAEFSIYNISIGDSEEKVIQELGNPNRLDASEYGFTWYIYNEDYTNYVQVGIKDGKVVGLYTNSANWESKKGIKLGSTSLEVQKAYGTPLSYILKGNTRYYISADKSEVNTFLIDNSYVNIFYDIYNNQTVTSILIIDKDTELSLKSFYGEESEELIEAYEKQIFDLANAIRARNGLNPYTWDEKAAKSSRLHSQDMAENNFFNHTNLDGESPFDRMKDQGIIYMMAGENIAAGQTSAIYAHEGWMNSEGHRKNILGDFERLGTGVAFGGEYKIYYTQNFYTPMN
ncbi:CAP-associated domain-containing protein [Defluviitalea phaphyphila]|uniref:CAP-associated domain-containing protein n=1 Tax=Defluviitalea phaphyphila TaxID=1473580 RepID=UPI00073046D8|nr:CAP-associated domain-containing protein [Defluviitalea phaphyphila]